MEDGAVTAEGDEEVGGAQLLLRRPAGHPELPLPALGLEGQAVHRLQPHGPEDALRLLGGGQALIPVGVGAQNHFFHSPTSSSAP